MALIVEDGTGLATAESYVSSAFADTYHAARGNTTWADVDDKDGALRRATDFMVNMYRMRWKGYRTNTVQVLDWPRSLVEKPDTLWGGFSGIGYYLINEIPIEIKTACCELALRAATGDLAPDITPDDMAKMVKVGPIEIQYKDFGTIIKVFRSVEAKLAPFFVSNAGTARLIRT